MRLHSRAFALALVASFAAPPVRAALLSEAWFSSTIQGKHVGYLRETREVYVESGVEQVRTTMETRLALKRMGTELEVTSRAEFIETKAGVPVRFESVSRLAESDYVVRAEHRDGHFVVVQESLGKRTETEVGAAEDVLFPHALDAAILTRGAKPGERLELRTFSPDAARPTRLLVECKGYETTPLADGKPERLLRFETTQDVLPGVTLVEWRDAKGDVRKTLLPLLGIEIVSHRTTRERALLPTESAEMLVYTLIDPGTRIPRPAEIARLRLGLALAPGARGSLAVPTDARQRVTGRAERGLTLEIRPERWEKGEDGPGPGAEYLAASAAIQSDDPEVVRIAATLPKGDRREVAHAITRWVHENVTHKSLSVGLATAAEVARNRAGDCTEHAVLAAALARARRIPSRVAMGLVYVDGVFGYHMWTEVWDGGWRAIDAALGQAEPDATHIKLAESSLANGFVDDALLGLVQTIASLGVTVVEYELDGNVYAGASAVLSGKVNDRVYENGPYRLKLEVPKGWKLALGATPPDPATLVRLVGPGGASGALTARGGRGGSDLRAWVEDHDPSASVVSERPVQVAKLSGRRFVVERAGRREGIVAFVSRETLFAIRIAPLGKAEDAALARVVESIELD